MDALQIAEQARVIAVDRAQAGAQGLYRNGHFRLELLGGC